MREILFKAKQIDNCEWVEGSLVKIDEEDFRIATSADCLAAYTSNGLFDGWMEEIDRNTICQYTGLTDKNGNKIWENDIVKCQDVLGKINWNETHASFVILADENGNMRYYYIDECLAKDDIEVIGNIFDNPELL